MHRYFARSQKRAAQQSSAKGGKQDSGRPQSVTRQSLCMRTVSLFVGILCGTSASWQSPVVRPAAGPRRRIGVLAASSSQDNSEDSSSEYRVDWDSAWSAEIARREDISTWRPEGLEPPTTSALANARLKTGVDNAQATLQTWSGDWRVWVGFIAALSVATALVGHSSDGAQGYSV